MSQPMIKFGTVQDMTPRTKALNACGSIQALETPWASHASHQSGFTALGCTVSDKLCNADESIKVSNQLDCQASQGEYLTENHRPTTEEVNARTAERRYLLHSWERIHSELLNKDSQPSETAPTQANDAMEDVKRQVTEMEMDFVTKCALRPPLPDGASLQLAADFDKYLAALAECEALTQSSLELSEEEKMFLSGEKAGFHPQELIDKYALTMPPRDPPRELCSNLDNPIRAMFAMKHWAHMTETVYEELKPGLRLASLFLCHWSCAPYWHTLREGPHEIEIDEANNRRICRINGPPREWTEEGERGWFQDLDKLAKVTEIHFEPEPHGLDNVFGAIRCCAGGGDVARCEMALSADYYTVAKKLSETRHKDPLMVLRFSLLFAVTLCHEVAHAADTLVRSRLYDAESEPNSGVEVHWENADWAEAGLTWECTMFDGWVRAISDRADAAHGLVLHDGVWRGVSKFYSIPMEYIHAVQRTESWPKTVDEYSGWQFFHIPKIGAVAYGSKHARVFLWQDEATAREAAQANANNGYESDSDTEPSL